MPTVRVPLVGGLTSRDDANTRLFGASQKDQFFENCHFQVTKNPVTGKASAWVMGRTDYAPATATPSAASGEGTAIHYWRGHPTPTIGNILSAFGDTNSTLYTGGTSLGAITGRCLFISETTVSGVATVLFVSGSNRAYYYTLAGSLTEITDADFPSKQTPALVITGNFVSMDGFSFIMCTNGQIWHSDLNSVSGWTSTAKIETQEYPDPGVGLARHKNYIVAFSKNSIEFFINAGNAAGAVLSRVSNMASQVGCISQLAICEFQDSLCWIGQSSGAIGVYSFGGGGMGKLSTPEIDFFIQNSEGDDLRMNVMNSYGKAYLALHVGSASACYMYDSELKLWHLWTLEHKLTQSDAPGEAAETTVSNALFYVGDTTPYIIYNATSRPVTDTAIQTSLIDFQTSNRKTLSNLRVVGDRASTTSNITVSFSDDDYQSFGTGRTVNMASALPQMHRCGMFRRRGIRITGFGYADVAERILRLEALELDYEISVN